MIKKIYDNIKEFILENYLYLTFLLVTYATLTYPLPYFIYTGGGIVSVEGKIVMKEKTESKGSYNLCYVKEVQATIPTYLLSFVMSDWERVSTSDISIDEEESMDDIKVRNKLYLDIANQSAVLSAFRETDKNYSIEDVNPVVMYVLPESDTDLKIGDEVISVDGINVESINDIVDVLIDKNVGDRLVVKVKNNGKDYDRYAVVFKEKDKKLLGISLENIVYFNIEPAVLFNFSSSESGPSGGLMVSLALYDYLVDEDLSKGLKISGTGTIDINGNVGEIGGVKYKLKGAVKKKSDVFFVPNGENYEEAIKLKEDKGYDIEVVGVSTLKDAIDYLKQK